jgi:signal transduction histidine kinase
MIAAPIPRFDDSLELRVAELERRCEEYRVLDESSDAIPFRMTPDLQAISYIGPQAAGLLRIAADEWTRPGFFEARLSPEDRLATIEQFRLVVEFGAAHEAEFRFRRDDGTWAWVRCAMRLFESNGTTTLAGHFTDITVRRSLASDISQFQRLEAVGRLAAGVAHEINTPIQFVGDAVGFVTDSMRDVLEVLAHYRALALPPEDAARLAEIEARADLDYVIANIMPALERGSDGLERVATLVRAMKVFAHRDSQHKEPADLHAALQATTVISTSEHKYVADIVTAFGDVPPVTCRINELNQVFLNLLVNAAHAIGDVMTTTGERGTITISTAVDGDNVVVSIADTGTGIPESIRDRIFDPFFTTKEVGKGTGQGLSIASSIVQQHNGSLTFDSELGRGTTFHVRLPISG